MATFEKIDSVSLPPLKLNIRIDQFLKQFILAQTNDLLSDAVDILDGTME
ncbi:TPA: hypothetical protein ACGF9M_003684 [Vibrio cholerae]